MREILRRLGYLFTRNRRRRELDAEMDFHREMSERAGRPEARRKFGNTERLKEQAHEAWGWTWIDRLGQDLSYAVRMLARSPGFTAVAVLVLAIGIGVNVAAFSMFNLALLRSLPVRNPDTLLLLQRRSLGGEIAGLMPYPTAAFYRDHARTLSAMLTMAGARVELDDDVEPLRGNFVSANFFTELGAVPAYGRLFQPSLDETPAASPVAVLGYGFWQTHFAANPAIIGRVVRINHKPVTIVGIVPEEFPGLHVAQTDVWMPITQQPTIVEGSKLLTDTSGGAVEVWGRLAPGATSKAAEAELLSLTNERRKLVPKDVWDGEYIHSDPGARIIALNPRMTQALAIFATLTLLILAVACANLGGLLLARGVVREHEIGIRLAIGASRKRIFRQLFTESLLLAILGSAAGLALACAAIRVMNVVTDSPKWMSAAPDWRVILFTVGMAVTASLFFGFAPALQLARQRHKRTIARQVLVGAQVAASCVLLIVSSLLVRAVQHLLTSDPGFGYEQVISVSPHLGDHGYKPAEAQAYFDQLEARLRALSGVASVSLAKISPLGLGVTRMDTKVDGRTLEVYPNWISPEFFRALEIPILTGRNFLPGEKDAAIVSQSMAQKQWPGQNPLGKMYGKAVVVGVAGNARVNALSEDDSVEIYWPAQAEDMPDMNVVLRTDGVPDSLPPRLKTIVQNLDPKLFPEISLLRARFHEAARSLEVSVSILTGVGMVAVLLAAVGIFGLVAFTISQRGKEIAIRLALGSPSGQAIGAVLGQFCWPVLIGVGGGLGLTAAFSHVLRFMLFGVNHLDPLSYASAMAILLAIVALAASVPARRALRIDIARTLHQE